MNSLRQSYNIKKNHNSEIISEAAIKWLAKNVILINEKIDRSTVSRLIDNIQKFENTFGEYKDKLPTIANYLISAEAGLRLVITGQTTERKTGNMLEQLTYLYSTFSDFFTRDLPVLLRTNLFDSAKDNPDIHLNQLRIQTAGRFDIGTVRDVLANALKPSIEERKLLSKIYRSTTLPKLNAEAIANEMLNLTYNDFETLTKVGKVPMAVTDAETGAKELSGELPEAITYSTPKFNKTNLATLGINEGMSTYVTGATAEEVLRRAIKMSRLDEAIILEAKMLMEADVAEIQPVINAIKQLASNVELLKPLSGPINDLQSKVLEVLADGDIKAYLTQATKQRNPLSFLKNLFATPKGKILAQANMAIETVKNVAKAWAQVQPVLQKDQLTKQDIVNIKKIISKATIGGVVGKLASVFKTQPFVGLAPQDILDALMQPLNQYLQTASFFEVKNNEGRIVKEQNEPATQTPATGEQINDDAAEVLETFKTGMQQLATAMKAKGGSSSTQAAKQTAKPNQPDQTQAANTAQAGAPAAPAAQAGAPAAAGVADETAETITTAFKDKLKPEQVRQLTNSVNFLTSQGYKVVKK